MRKRLYAKRQAVERMFKALKQSRRLEQRCLRGCARHALFGRLSLYLRRFTRTPGVPTSSAPR